MLIKLLIGSLALLLVLFIALVWLVADLLHISMLVPALVTAFLVLAGVCIVLYRKVRATNAAQGLERELAAQAKAQAKLVRPDLQAEVQGMQAEFDKAVLALKSAKLGPGGRNALYFLPWYTIIGPPGAGKSTALRSSGLQFPYTSGSGGAAVKGLGGTRNCDWWLTNEAVVLDTAGRWSTQEEDHDEWLSFLGLLKRYRPKKPLNGIIAAISVGDVANAREDEVESVAQRMRERLD
ncbi:MAG TPA: type VI secretion protein IcmF/TssM N-terminal domain-containing protein, partial [Polyangiales bacterium]|nr:type VI secretion protein IcmF/TssM N-terminal domain-containing protein [Polyangiales bacterium]